MIELDAIVVNDCEMYATLFLGSFEVDFDFFAGTPYAWVTSNNFI